MRKLHRRDAATICGAIAVCFAQTVAALAEDTTGSATPPIRAFDIPAIESLGRQMYEQDQEAWKATDVLRAQHSQSELRDQKVDGWIVEKLTDHDVVRFIRDGANGPEGLYDVNFVNGQPQGLSTPSATSLNVDELAEYAASTLAIKNIGTPCSDHYNTVVLRDPQGKGWLAWAMAATTDPDALMMGGHFRFTISADGKTIIQKDQLSRGCLRMSKGKGVPEGDSLTAMHVSQVVSLTPVETHVFANLSYGIPLYVGTLDGTTWKIFGGHVTTVNEDSPGIDGFSARTFAGEYEKCRFVLASADDKDRKYFVGGETQVISALEHTEKLTNDAPQDKVIVGAACSRLSIVPSPNDYKVLRSGLDLSIMDRGQGHPKRMGTLKISNGQITYTLHKDDPPFDADTASHIQARLSQLQNAWQASH